jgi:hypothetical protein
LAEHNDDLAAIEIVAPSGEIARGSKQLLPAQLVHEANTTGYGASVAGFPTHDPIAAKAASAAWQS